jgi:hypothetical protein
MTVMFKKREKTWARPDLVLDEQLARRPDALHRAKIFPAVANRRFRSPMAFALSSAGMASPGE